MTGRLEPEPELDRVAPLSMDNTTRRPLHVVHVASGDLWAGAEVQLFNLMIELSRDPAVRVTAILLNPGLLEQRLRAQGVVVIVIDEGRMGSLEVFAKLLKEVKRLCPDVVHTHRLKENVLGSIVAKLSGSTSLRTVHGAEEFSFSPWQFHKRLYRALDRWCGRLLQRRVVAVSSSLASKMEKVFSRHRIATIENGIGIENLRQAGTTDVVLPGPNDAIRVAMVARLVQVKRTDIFLDIAERVTTTDARFRFYLLGDGPLAASIRSTIAQRGLTGRVYVMGFKDPLSPYLAKMDMMLITSDHEGLPVNLLEAMALGVPVIAHATGGIPDVLDRGDYGTLIGDQDVAKYVAAVLSYRSDSSRMRQKALRAKMRVEQRYSTAVCADGYKRLYRELAAAG